MYVVGAQMKTFRYYSILHSVPLGNHSSRLRLVNAFFGLETHEHGICSTVASEGLGLPGDLAFKILPFPSESLAIYGYIVLSVGGSQKYTGIRNFDKL